MGEAVLPLREAAALDPSAAIRHDLGYVYLQCGRLAEAAAAFEAALEADPHFGLAALRLGTVRQALGDETAALLAYRRAAASRPPLAEAWHRLASMLESHGRQAEATAAFERAAAAAPDTSLGRLACARAQLAQGQDASAEQSLRQALAAAPDYVPAIDLLGTLHAEAGRLDEARTCYERSTAASPHWAGSYYDLVRCRRITPDDAPLIARMRATLARPDLQPELRQKLHLALGKAAEDLGEFAEAMRQFDAADAERSRLGPHLASLDAAAIETRVDRLIAHFKPERLALAAPCAEQARLPRSPPLSPQPILIVGLPRSGTTLVEQILSCHPDVHAGGELPFWTGRGAHWEQLVGDPAARAETAADYTGLLRTLAPSATRVAARVTDKMPLNVFWVGLVRLCLPHATIVLVRREPIDVALSIHQTYFNPHVALPTGGAALVRTIRAVDRLADHWRAALQDERVVELRYEHLVTDPDAAIRSLVVGCGLAWNEACLRPQDNARVVRTPSKWQVRQPIGRRAEQSWRRYQPWLGALAALAPRDGAEGV